MPFLCFRSAGAAGSTNTLAAGAGRATGERGDAAHPSLLLTRRRRTTESCKNATCVVCVLETARMRSFSRRSDCGLGPGAWRPLRCCNAARHAARCALVSCFCRRTRSVKMDESEPQRSAPIIVTREPSQRPSQRDWLYLSVEQRPLNPALNIYKSRAGRGETRGLRGPQHWAPGRASRVTSPVQIVGCPPARPSRPEGVAPRPKSGLPERPRTTPKAESGLPS